MTPLNTISLETSPIVRQTAGTVDDNLNSLESRVQRAADMIGQLAMTAMRNHFALTDTQCARINDLRRALQNMADNTESITHAVRGNRGKCGKP